MTKMLRFSGLNNSSLTELPHEVLHEIGLKLSLPDLFNLCQTGRYIQQVFCDDDRFWHYRFIQDLGESKISGASWKEMYKTMGNVYVFGNNNYGQLGLGDRIERDVPTKIRGIRAKKVSAGKNHTLLLDFKDQLWGFGHNDHGQLGLDIKFESLVPRLIATNVKDMSAGGKHSLFITSNGEVWGMGDNTYGQLGSDELAYIITPERISFATEVRAVSVSAGGHHSMVLDTKGRVWTFGRNHEDQLGGSPYSEETTPIQIAFPPGPVGIISAGTHHSVIVKRDDLTVWTFGSNKHKQLGLGNQDQVGVPTQVEGLRAQAVDAAGEYTAILTPEGRVQILGGYFHYLFEPEDVEKFFFNGRMLVPGIYKGIAAGAVHCLLIHATTSTVWSFGWNEHGQLGFRGPSSGIPLEIKGLKAQSISAGDMHSVVLGYFEQ